MSLCRVGSKFHKIFIFSCIEVINVTIVVLLRHGSAVLNGINIP